ncbi:MAG: DUF3107 domain-containing protein [Acidimicrobiales bacterium]
MDVRIGVIQTAREVEVELAEDIDPAELRTQIEQSLADETGVLWLTDRRGRQVAVPTSKVAYVEIGSPSDSRRIGFGG